MTMSFMFEIRHVSGTCLSAPPASCLKSFSLGMQTAQGKHRMPVVLQAGYGRWQMGVRLSWQSKCNSGLCYDRTQRQGLSI